MEALSKATMYRHRTSTWVAFCLFLLQEFHLNTVIEINNLGLFDVM
jgi:hypothetical protein